MNRIILIGNGFDLAHGLQTSYKDFIDNYWTEFAQKIYHRGYNAFVNYWENGDFASFDDGLPANQHFPYKLHISVEQLTSYEMLKENIPRQIKTGLKFNNDFFKRISERTGLENWVDIEREYYDALKELLPKEETQERNKSAQELEEDRRQRKEKIIELNKEFKAIKNRLEKYLTCIIENATIEKHQSIQDVFSSHPKYEEIAISKQKYYRDENGFPELINNFKQIPLHYETLILNFNYTKTAKKLYGKSNYSVINIHGELNNSENQIIFGYGDELDDDYKKIEKLQDNDFLENIKSIQYYKTRNYRRLLKFIEWEPYQVLVMGHSCGNSDRTLLNTLFEHENCVSLKVFYWQKEINKDDYTDLIMNISRNFEGKKGMRDVVVDYGKCTPLVPVATSK
jgi:hypothetical protein